MPVTKTAWKRISQDVCHPSLIVRWYEVYSKEVGISWAASTYTRVKTCCRTQKRDFFFFSTRSGQSTALPLRKSVCVAGGGQHHPIYADSL